MCLYPHRAGFATLQVFMARWWRVFIATLNVSRQQIPHNDIPIITAGGQEGRWTLGYTQDVLLVTILLRTSGNINTLLYNERLRA